MSYVSLSTLGFSAFQKQKKYAIITFARFAAYFMRGIQEQQTGLSSNGRTLVFGTSYQGSNPCSPATYRFQTRPERVLF